MRKLTLLLLLLSACGIELIAQNDLLLSGPMVGYCEMREAALWVQTNGPAQVYFTYASEDQPNRVFRTAVSTTQKESAFTTTHIAEQVLPGKTYKYNLYINGAQVTRPYDFSFKTPPLWHFRTDPPEMKIAMGSCVFVNDSIFDRPGTPYGSHYEIMQQIHAQQPDMMLWLGDNTYLREADWYSRTGIIHRYTHTRNMPEMQALLASTANYATWDDHDYGPNNSDYTWRNKDVALEAFKMFWANPSYGLGDNGGVTTTFEWGDAEFFVVDNRYFRTPNYKDIGERTMLGEEQLEWLIDALISSSSNFKFVMIGGQVINSADVFENYANHAPNERQRILNAIAAEGIKNVIFLTGDRHHSELSKWQRNGITVYDFTSSPLTSGTHDALDEPNRLRVEGSHVAVHNFGTMEITGPRRERKLTFRLFDSEGKELWSHEIEAQ